MCPCRLSEKQQRIGGFFLNLMPQMKLLYVAYCSNHPSAVNVLIQHRYSQRRVLLHLSVPEVRYCIVCVCVHHSEELGQYMEAKGSPTPGILTLTTSLSKPFTRLERYPTLLKELDRHMEVSYPSLCVIVHLSPKLKRL